MRYATMTHSSQSLSHPIIPVPIASESEQLARDLAQQHPMQEHAEQVYRNLLAVFTVNNYVKILGLPTDLTHCDCWNPFLRMTLNVADLEIVGYGRLECRPVSQADLLPEATSYIVPADIDEDERIGYVVVQIDGDLERYEPKTAQILGFTKQSQNGMIDLTNLTSMFELPDYLATCLETQTPKPFVTHLTRWFENTVEQSWQAVDELLHPSLMPSYQVRALTEVHALSDRVFAKLLTLDTVYDGQSVFLIVKVTDSAKAELDIELKICSASDQVFLPPGLDVTVVDEDNQSVMNAQARAENRWVEMGFHAERGDRFQLRIQLDTVVLTEFFLV